MNVRMTIRLSSGVDGCADLVHVMRVIAPDVELADLQGAIDVARDCLIEGNEPGAVAVIAQIADGDSAYELFELIRKYPDQCTLANDYDVIRREKFSDRYYGGIGRSTGGEFRLGRHVREQEEVIERQNRQALAGRWKETT